MLCGNNIKKVKNLLAFSVLICSIGLSGCALDMEKVSISNYEKAFKHISSVTGEKNIDKIVENFIRKEEQNFALFNYVNELNNEIETLRHQLRKLKDNMEQFSEEDEQLKENRKGMMKKLEVRTLVGCV